MIKVKNPHTEDVALIYPSERGSSWLPRRNKALKKIKARTKRFGNKIFK